MFGSIGSDYSIISLYQACNTAPPIGDMCNQRLGIQHSTRGSCLLEESVCFEPVVITKGDERLF